MVAFRPADGGLEQILLIFGNPRPEGAPLVRLHSQCFTGDVLHSQRCDCGEQLEGALERLAQEKEGGILIYLTQEGRGIGLTNKLRAYRLQDQGLDTLDANLRLGFGADEREYAAAAALLKAMGFMRITLLSNNPAKAEALRAQGIEVVGMARHAFPANRHNRSYLATKAKRFGHLF
jgi:GTP cyclohydrolase II